MFTNEIGEKNHNAKYLRDKLHRQLDLALNSSLPLTNYDFGSGYWASTQH